MLSIRIDERKGRRAAQAVGLQVTGTLGLLGRAKSLGRVVPMKIAMRYTRDDLSGRKEPLARRDLVTVDRYRPPLGTLRAISAWRFPLGKGLCISAMVIVFLPLSKTISFLE
jgi:hypothetical protein